MENMDVGDCCTTSGRKFRVGCALLPKKVSRYLTSSMRKIARSKGVELVLLDHTKPILDQGEYDAIVHKLRPNKEWERNLQEYIRARPGVKVIDSLAGIRIVHNRATMLLPLRENPGGITLQRPYMRHGKGSYGVARIQSPTQVEITEGTSLVEAQSLLQRSGLMPPLLVKPLWTDGREGSHGLAVLHDMAALGKVLQGDLASCLKPPLVVQQFVDHGGVLFKVYVLGARTVVCMRPSLGDSHLGQEARRAGVLPLPRISCKSSYTKGSAEDRLSAGFVYDTLAAARNSEPGNGGDIDVDGSNSGLVTGPPAWGRVQAAKSAPDLGPQRPPTPPQELREQQQPQPLQHPAAPPDWVTSALAGTLRDKLGLQLFNFDMICPEEQPQPRERLYYVVDINYFPGVDKIPDFEHIFVDFLTAACKADSDGGGGAAAAASSGAGGGGSGCDHAALPDADMAGSGEDGISSVSSDKGDLGRLLLGADAPAPAAEAITAWGIFERQSSDGQ